MAYIYYTTAVRHNIWGVVLLGRGLGCLSAFCSRFYILSYLSYYFPQNMHFEHQPREGAAEHDVYGALSIWEASE